MHWIKSFSFLKKSLLRILNISNILNMYLLSLLRMSSSSAQLSVAFSELLEEITHFTRSFSRQQTVTISYFHQTILSLVGEISSWPNIYKQGGSCNKNVLVCIF